MSLKKYALVVGCFCWVMSSGDVAGMMNDQTSIEVSQIATIIEKASKSSGYQIVRSYHPSDEWEAEESKKLVDSHAYYTLYGEDSDEGCLSSKGRIEVTVLIFKDADLARRHIVHRKEYHQGNMFVGIIRSNDDGFLLEEVNGFYGAVIRGSQVILFEDRSSEQSRVIRSMTDTLAKAPR